MMSRSLRYSPLARAATLSVSAVLSASLIAGCGGGDPYCDAVKKDEKTLNTFGQERTNEAYTEYSTVFRSIGKLAPGEVSQDWAALADATDGVLEAQSEVGLDLKDMKKAAKVKKLDEAQLATLNTAYEAFNSTSAQRTAVVTNVKQVCKITLK